MFFILIVIKNNKKDIKEMKEIKDLKIFSDIWNEKESSDENILNNEENDKKEKTLELVPK